MAVYTSLPNPGSGIGPSAGKGRRKGEVWTDFSKKLDDIIMEKMGLDSDRLIAPQSDRLSTRLPDVLLDEPTLMDILSIPDAPDSDEVSQPACGVWVGDLGGKQCLDHRRTPRVGKN